MAAHTTYFNGVLSDQIAERPKDEAKNHEQLRAYQLSHGVFDGRFRWLQPPPRGLTDEERVLVDQIGGGLLAELGYANDSSWIKQPSRGPSGSSM